LALDEARGGGAHKEGQQIEGFGLEVDDIGAAAQFAALDVEPVAAEHQNHPLLASSRRALL